MNKASSAQQLRTQPAGVGDKIQQPEVHAWRELEERLMLGALPKELNEGRVRTPHQTTTIKKEKKSINLETAPISELWR